MDTCSGLLHTGDCWVVGGIVLRFWMLLVALQEKNSIHDAESDVDLPALRYVFASVGRD
jgi:hypothetical protein